MLGMCICMLHERRKKSESNLGVKDGNNVSCKCERDFHLCKGLTMKLHNL